jgi:hypothetical protein
VCVQSGMTNQEIELQGSKETNNQCYECIVRSKYIVGNECGRDLLDESPRTNKVLTGVNVVLPVRRSFPFRCVSNETE